MLEPAQDVGDPEFWDARYAQGSTPWDLGRAPTVLRELIGRLDVEAAAVPRRVLCPGAGRGHDALAWASAGFETVAVDMAPSAISAAAELAARGGVGVELLQADLFELSRTHTDAFDVVWEQTCLCAIDPRRRVEYVDTMAAVLRPRGDFWALLWNHGNDGGPPWDLEADDVRALLDSRFSVESATPVTSGTRPGEFLIHARRR